MPVSVGVVFANAVWNFVHDVVRRWVDHIASSADCVLGGHASMPSTCRCQDGNHHACTRRDSL